MEENDIFAMQLQYHDSVINSGDPVQYNGNISSIKWATNLNKEWYGYDYSYDEINRLTHATFYKSSGEGFMHDGSFDERNISYDPNGNLLTLHRFTSGAIPIDKLRYSYLSNGNQLGYIVDSTLDVSGVIDYPGGITATEGFAYDLNGNMVISADKGMNDSIRYSYLNMPELLDFGNGEKIRYIYDGTGNKVAKLVIDGNALPGSSLIYAGNFVYDWNGNLQYILTSEGRIVAEETAFRFEYFIKDHLGNTRATYAQAAPGLPQVVEYRHYYPFGMQIEALGYSSGFDLPNNYRYNGKELQTDYGLEWYDYGARFYDPQLGRWHVIDPLAEQSRRWSPYTYCMNNPIRFIDPDGRNVDWYEHKNNNGSTSTIWKPGNAEQVSVMGETYNRTGETYTQDIGSGASITYNQNEAVELTENVLSPNDWESQRTADGTGNKPGDEGNCFYQSGEMVKASGAESLPGTANNISDKKEGVNYINNQIDQGSSVRVHVDRTGDKAGDHWIAISSRTTDLLTQAVKSFGFYDPGTSKSASGTHNSNSLNSGSLTGVTFYSGKTYTVTEVRKNIEK
jgi:RHS repeat-associated protein